jgi:RNA polymerase sigma-70 factor (ECF subfamily)
VKDPSNIPGSGDSRGVPGTTTANFLKGVQARDADAWWRLAHLYGPLVYGWCRRQGLQPSDCEDIVQEVFVTVVARVGDFERRPAGGTFRGWLWQITRHKLGDWLRRQQARARPLDDLAAPSTIAPPPAAATDAPAGDLLHRALELIRPEFEPASWQAFWSVAVEGHKPADVAADLGLSPNAVYIAKSRILSRLRAVLGEE